MASQSGQSAAAIKREHEASDTPLEILGHVRKRRRRPMNPAVTSPSILTTHKVICSREAPGHQRHEEEVVYLEPPKLIAGDCRASPLRGKTVLQHQGEYLETHPEVAFTVLKTYDCEQYHAKFEHRFDKIPVPNLDPGETALVRPYFSVLPEDCPLASPTKEGLTILQEDTINSIDGLNSRITGKIGEKAFRSEIQAPYIPLYHLRGEVEADRRAANDIHCRFPAVDHLFKYLEEAFGAQYREADLLFSHGMVSRRHFTKLFRETDIVVSSEDGHLVAFQVDRCLNGKDGATSDSVELQCHRLLFDRSFKRRNVVLQVQWPNGQRDIRISSLSAYPLRFDSDGVAERLLARGLTFWSCRNRRFASYTAPKRTFEMQVVNPRYMIDMEVYHQSHPKEEDIGYASDDGLERDTLVQVNLDHDQPPNDEFLIMLPPRILGFGLHDKRWKNLLVEHIQDIQWNKTAFDRLVLGSEKKSLITAMVKEHVLSDITTDVIEGKGNGLIILLHGAPGTGKTLTAESVAEVAEKPLYRVTCGDIGTDAEGVEKYLESVLYIATMWKAVVLFDESDVFLEERSQADLQRNALVSAFLRVLEYYDGILILTTNRVGTFDEAFKSRIHLAIHYPKLDNKGRREIWNDFIHDLEHGETNEDGDGESRGVNAQQLRTKLNLLALEDLNGRQIRNIIRTGRQLASHRREALGYEHLQISINVIKEFEDYIEETHGHTDEQFATAQNSRA